MATLPRHRWQHQNETAVSDEEWIDPLRQFHRRIIGERAAEDFVADQFTADHFYVGPRLLRPGLPNLHVYRHMETGRTLAVDTRGAAYRYIPPDPEGVGGHWKRHMSLANAIADLDLPRRSRVG